MGNQIATSSEKLRTSQNKKVTDKKSTSADKKVKNTESSKTKDSQSKSNNHKIQSVTKDKIDLTQDASDRKTKDHYSDDKGFSQSISDWVWGVDSSQQHVNNEDKSKGKPEKLKHKDPEKYKQFMRNQFDADQKINESKELEGQTMEKSTDPDGLLKSAITGVDQHELKKQNEHADAQQMELAKNKKSNKSYLKNVVDSHEQINSSDLKTAYATQSMANAIDDFVSLGASGKLVDAKRAYDSGNYKEAAWDVGEAGVRIFGAAASYSEEAFKWAGKGISKLNTAGEELLKTVAPETYQAIKSGVGAAKEVLEPIASTANKALQKATGSDAKQILEWANKPIEEALDDSGRAIAKKAKTIAEDTGKVLKEVAEDTGKAVKEFAEDTGKAIINKAKDTGKAVKEIAEDTGKAIINKAKDTGKAVKEIAEDTGKAIINKAKDTGKAVKEFAEDTGKAIINKAKDTGKAVKEVAEDTLEAAKKIIEKIEDDMFGSSKRAGKEINLVSKNREIGSNFGKVKDTDPMLFPSQNPPSKRLLNEEIPDKSIIKQKNPLGGLNSDKPGNRVAVEPYDVNTKNLNVKDNRNISKTPLRQTKNPVDINPSTELPADMKTTGKGQKPVDVESTSVKQGKKSADIKFTEKDGFDVKTDESVYPDTIREQLAHYNNGLRNKISKGLMSWDDANLAYESYKKELLKHHNIS